MPLHPEGCSDISMSEHPSGHDFSRCCFEILQFLFPSRGIFANVPVVQFDSIIILILQALV